MANEKPTGQEFHIDVAETGTPVITLLQQSSSLSLETLRDAVFKGALWLGIKGKPKRLRDADAESIGNSTLHLYYNPAVINEEPAEARLIEDLQDYSVWYKPFGMRSQGSRWSDHCTIYRWAETHLEPERPALIVHRLDRAATGLLLLAHSKEAARKLADLFQRRQIEKQYQCIVHGKFPAKPEERKISNDLDGKTAISFARRLKFSPAAKRSLVEIRIETGRKHQIRRHLSDIGFPVVGDRLYGRDGDKEDLMLTAISLSFVCPLSGWKRSFELPEKLRPKLD